MLTRFVRIQLAIFTIASIVGVLVMVFTYMQAPTLLGIGRITVKLELPASGGLYRFSNVTYRGVQVEMCHFAAEHDPAPRVGARCRGYEQRQPRKCHAHGHGGHPRRHGRTEAGRD